MAFFKLLRKSPVIARIGMVMILLNIAAAILAPVIAPYGETEVVGDVWMPMSSDHFLGTDHIGRDMFTRLLYGARNTIAIAFVITLFSFAVGISCGFFAATLGGWTDLIISRLVDILMAIPVLIFALVVLAVVGNSIPKLIVVIALLDSTRVYRLSRAVAMDIEVMEYVEAARFIAALSFLGLGIQPPTADWGGMVRENSGAITFGIFTPLWPAGAIAFLTVGVNFIVDWFLHVASGLKD
jgi:peptide/nickel transport system permease protein